MNIPTSYKVGILGLLTLAAIIYPKPAHADLHDTYAQSCSKNGGPGIVNKEAKLIAWHTSNHTEVEAFVKNECVYLKLVADKGAHYQVEDMERILANQAGNKQVWIPLDVSNDKDFVAGWTTDDGLILAGLYSDGSCQFAYAWYLKDKGLLLSPVPFAHAPVEDDAPAGTKL